VRLVKDGLMKHALPSSSDVVSRLTGVPSSVERAITVDQTNRSVVVDERYVVKWLAQPVRGVMHGVNIRRHLSHNGFRSMPGLVGTFEHDGLTFAVVTDYIAGALDGWDWLVDDVLAWLDGSLDRTEVMMSCHRLGALVATFLLAMAQPSDVWPEPALVSGGEHQWWRQRGLILLDEATMVEPELMAAHRQAVVDQLDVLDGSTSTAVQWIHGDLHVGQVLRATGQLWLTDFDGDPLGGQPTPRTAMRDVVGLLQSLDHVGRIVNRRTQDGHADQVAHWIDDAIDTATTSLESIIGPLDQQLLGPLSVIQELHELVYAARHLPRWRYVPAAALPAALARY
jgi:maltokinase